jgi:hypothetical protein
MDSQAQEVCSLVAEIGFVMAGFAALAVSLRSRQSDEWPPAARLRARALLHSSLVPGLLALLVLGLSASGIADGIVYRAASALWLGATVPFAFIAARDQRHFAAAAESSINFGRVGNVMWLGSVLVAALQAVNILVLGLFWPVFAGFFFHLLSAAHTFYRLMFLGSR